MPAIVQEIREKIKGLLADQAFFTASLLILVALASFGLGRQSVNGNEPPLKPGNTEPNSVVPQNTAKDETERPTSTPSGTYYVASRNGQVYHLPYCSGAKRISEQNLITFNNKEEAAAAGYRPAANCPGI